MAKKKDPFSFNFGANKKPKARKPKTGGGGKRRGTGSKGNAWRSYVGVSNAPIPD